MERQDITKGPRTETRSHRIWGPCHPRPRQGPWVSEGEFTSVGGYCGILSIEGGLKTWFPQEQPEPPARCNPGGESDVSMKDIWL